jgi:2-oxoglutarate/2-oxoacid ferredoxin oxidoreductase subunit alpha
MKDTIAIVLSGEAGQGIQTIEGILAKVLRTSGYNVFATKEYMSRVRGGVNSTTIIVSSKKISAYYEKIDLLIPLDKGRTKHLCKRIAKDTVILGENRNIIEGCDNDNGRKIEVPFSAVAEKIGNPIYSNIVAVGVVCGLLDVDKNILTAELNVRFAAKGDEVLSGNNKAAEEGLKLGKELISSGKVKVSIQKSDKLKDEIMVSGSEAIAIGAIAGGCNFVSAYPMTPSTGIFTFLSQQASSFGIVVEQAEDEISALNMSLGAWYAGARAFVTTSGGGYDLMQEALSLAGMIESPAVIALGMRPGPATGLPTRTEQGDLNLALYSGHGEFPRAIFAPGNLHQAFELTANAFYIADKYQVPVFILFDQYFGDTYYNTPQFDISDSRAKKSFLVSTKTDYSRYCLDLHGVCPRGIPGYGEGLVVVDSDEHDAEGHITEDLEVRDIMTKRRMKKQEAVIADMLAPELIGEPYYETLIVAWGSNYSNIKAAISGMDRTSLLHFCQVYPLHKDTLKFLQKAKKVVLVENNGQGQFGQLIKRETGFNIEHRILKDDGLPFSVEELKKKIEGIK